MRQRLTKRRAWAAAAGVMADLAFGEPRVDPHPVAVFGRFTRRIEGHIYADDRIAGLVHTAMGTLTGLAIGAALESTAFATYLSVAQRDLERAAHQVERALIRGELETARRLLPALVGRDPDGLDEKEIARAAIESVAENTVDAVVGPAIAAAFLGAPGATAYRAINTMDAIVGHRDDRYRNYGWASARLDDVVNLIPARVAGLLVMAVRPRMAADIARAISRDGPGHPSPNAGVIEAAFAAALDLRLGGTNRYGGRVEVRPSLGSGRAPEAADIGRSVTLSRHVTLALVAVLVFTGLVS